MDEDILFCYAMLSLASIAMVVVAVRQYISYRAAKRDREGEMVLEEIRFKRTDFGTEDIENMRWAILKDGKYSEPQKFEVPDDA